MTRVGSSHQISSGRFVQEDKLNRLNLIGGAV